MKNLSRSVIVLLLLSTCAMASAESLLFNSRVLAINEYFRNLETTNASAMIALFAQDGKVISTSQGVIDPGQFFSSFLPTISDVKVTRNDIYESIGVTDHYGASFHLSWVNADGSRSGANFVDEFIFQFGTDKLTMVRMFENTKM